MVLKRLRESVLARATDDTAKLAQLGYKQELKRELTYFHNFAMSFSVVSILTGLTGLYGLGYNYGGPVAIIWGWPLVSIFTLMVGLSLAEICSAYPTSGGLYFWSYALAGPNYRALASWVTGWFNLLGQAATTAGIDFTLANEVATVILLSTGTSSGGGRVLKPKELLGIYGAILVIHALLNTFAVQLLGILNTLSVWWHIFGTIVFAIVLPAVAPTRQDASFVFGTFRDFPDSGIHNSGYVFLLGLLLAQFTLTGYDASAHMTEETQGADFSGPLAIVATIIISFVVGWGYLMSITFSIMNPDAVTASDNAVGGGNAVAQILWDAFKGRYHSGTGALVMFAIPMVACFFCGLSSVTSNSRMLYAFSRDGAVPGSSLFRRVHPRTGTPIAAVWAMAAFAFILGIPVLKNNVAFGAVTSISTVGLYLSYGIPIFLRITVARDSFKPGPFHLGRWGIPVGIIACLWIAFITVLFVLPTAYPVGELTLNYAPVAVGAVIVLSLGWWVVDARRWFTGPRPNVEEVEEGQGVEPVKAVVP